MAGVHWDPGHCFPSCLVRVVVELSCAQAIMDIAIRLHATDYEGPAAGGLCWWGGVGGADFHEVKWTSGSPGLGQDVSCFDFQGWKCQLP